MQRKCAVFFASDFRSHTQRGFLWCYWDDFWRFSEKILKVDIRVAYNSENTVCTLEFLISISLRLLILWVFSRVYALIWDSYTTTYLGVYVYCFSQFFPGSTLIRNSRVLVCLFFLTVILAAKNYKNARITWPAKKYYKGKNIHMVFFSKDYSFLLKSHL